MIAALVEPSPKTVWVAAFQRSQARQPKASRLSCDKLALGGRPSAARVTTDSAGIGSRSRGTFLEVASPLLTVLGSKPGHSFAFAYFDGYPAGDSIKSATDC